MRYTILAILLAGCASAPPPEPTARAPGGERFVSRADCDKLVDHLDEVRFISVQPAPSGYRSDAFRAQNQSPDWHRARVDECTISVTPRDYVCLTNARDLYYANQCNSRFFASTMASYRG